MLLSLFKVRNKAVHDASPDRARLDLTLHPNTEGHAALAIAWQGRTHPIESVDATAEPYLPTGCGFPRSGHAVARLYVGAPATAVQIVPRGVTHGSRRWVGRGERRMWSWLLVLFAGAYGQAFATRRSLKRTMLHSGKLDMQEAAPVVTWLVKRGYAPTRMAVLRRTHAATTAFLLFRWDAIERVAAGL